jgi:DNA-binding LytR/AlgR family response regulator
MARLFIVEDEPIIAYDLKLCVEQAGHEISGMAETAAEALPQIVATSPDLLLLDINIKGSEDGIALARKVNALLPVPFIFITSYYDAQTLERVKGVNPAAYIVKPFKEEEVLANIQLALKKNRSAVAVGTPGKLFVRDGGILKPIKAEEVLFARGESNYTVLHMAGNRKFTVSHTLKSIEDKMPASIFCRVHKSYLINLEYIDLIEHSVVKVSGETIPIGKAYRASLFEKMQIL